MKITRLYLTLLLPLCLFLGCSSTISTFDQTAYTQVTSLKVDALDLMDKATENYTSHESEVKALQLNIDKAIEYDKHRPHNEITTQMWTILNDPQGHLFGGFLVKWKKDGKCNATYIVDKKKQISNSFDQIAELESKKIKPAQVTQ
ncbi:hypothetical protein [Mucilaginibacter sp. SG564]|uniref:hypothetical protein n=1 Tax=Mucilaginibacter sp. SG564 TaxID=2587022 RepID=UPI0015542806|nr:hypothetical protein [Mucilaginibacter sp. SG564]NOW93398.1 hypothetical protein [Mucilaginibacter sp. SG564]